VIRLVRNGNVVLVASNGIRAYNLSNPANPVLLSTYGDLSGSGAGAIFYQSNYVYDFAANECIVNYANPAQPSTIASAIPSGLVNSVISGVHLQNGRAYLASGNAGLQVVNVTTPSTPVLAATIQTFGTANDVKISNGIAYVAAQSDGLMCISVSSPTAPVIQGRLKVTTGSGSRNISNLAIAASAVYGTSGTGGLRRFDVSNPSAPTLISQYLAGGIDVYGVDVMPSYVLAGGYNGLTQMDVVSYATPASPSKAGSITITGGGSWTRAKYMNQRAYVIEPNATSKLHIVSLANPAFPSLLGTVSFSGFARDVAVTSDGSVAFVSHGSGGVVIVDCSVPSSPQQAGSYSTGVTSPNDMHLSGNRLLIGDGGSVQMADVSNPLAPVQLATFNTAGTALGIFGEGDKAYVADGQAGLAILRILDTTVPTIQIASPTSNSQWQTTQGTLDVGGTTSDDQGVTRVSWTNSRGGGGEATGTTAWSITGLTLAAGANVITVTASDAQGRSASDTLTVNYKAPDSLLPVITLTAPDFSNGELTVADIATVGFAGTASDNGTLASVTWSSDRGASGSATGLANWAIANIPLAPGPNVVTVTATDASGNASTVQVRINYLPPDSEPPQVEITFPVSVATMTVYSSTLSLSGTAQDNWVVQSVRWATDRDVEGSASGLLEWQAGNIPLQLGANVITITATDARRNQCTDMLNVIYRLPDQDNDGIPDESEVAYGLNPELTSDADDDADKDGMTNRAEHVAGTNPNSAADRFKMENPEMNPGGLTLQFKTVAGKYYCIEAAEELSGTWQIVKDDIIGTGGMTTYTDTSAMVGRTPRFYRAVVCVEQ
jgi:hypothetical protein